MIEHVYRRVASARGVDAVVVATDDDRIAAAVEGFGGVARMTRADHPTGMDRVAEVASALTCDIVVNVQGDEPLIDPLMIAEVLDPLLDDRLLQMATLGRLISDPADYASPHVVKVVVSQAGHAMYFSRAPVPASTGEGSGPPAYRHVGLYAYKRPFLLELAALPQTPLERAESLEQLRALEHGFRVGVRITEHESVSVDTPEDLERVRQHMAGAEPDHAPEPRPVGNNLELRRQ